MHCCIVLGAWILDPESRIKFILKILYLVSCRFHIRILCLGSCSVIPRILRTSKHFVPGVLSVVSCTWYRKHNWGAVFFHHFLVCSICDNYCAEEAHPHIKSNNVTSHNILRTTYIYYTCGKVLVCCLVVHCMVVWLTGIKYFINMHS